MTKQKYIICNPHDMERYYKEGYEYLAIFSDIDSHYINAATTHNSTGPDGNYNSYTNYTPVPQVIARTQVIMQLSTAATVLNGPKRKVTDETSG